MERQETGNKPIVAFSIVVLRRKKTRQCNSSRITGKDILRKGKRGGETGGQLNVQPYRFLESVMEVLRAPGMAHGITRGLQLIPNNSVAQASICRGQRAPGRLRDGLATVCLLKSRGPCASATLDGKQRVWKTAPSLQNPI